MRRRDFIKVIAGSAAVWPLAARAQRPNLPLIGFLAVSGLATLPALVDAFHKGLAEAGYIEGKNVIIEYRWAANYGELPALANELVEHHVAVLVAAPLSGGFAAKAATKTIPIVFESGGDPVEAGLVDNLNHPGGNITGVAVMTQQIVPKRLQLLHDLMPSASIFAMLVNPDARSTASTSAAAMSAAQALGVQLHILSTKSPDELPGAFAKIAELQSEALAVTPDPFFHGERKRILDLAARYKLPGIYFERTWVSEGGLMSYSASVPDAFYQIGQYAGRILKGEKPGNLPIQQPTTFELVINLKTANALGLSVPPTLLTIANEVIE